VVVRKFAQALRQIPRGEFPNHNRTGNESCQCPFEFGAPAMIRPVLTEIVIFLIPFAIYAMFLLATRSGVLTASSWPVHVVTRLAAGAFLLTIVSLVLLANFSGAPPRSTYEPAHMQDGKLVRGTEK